MGSDPDDACTLTEYAFLLRGTGQSVQVVHETRRLGLFGRDTWLRLLASAGFEPGSTIEVTTENRPPRELFTGHRRRGPAAPPASNSPPLPDRSPGQDRPEGICPDLIAGQAGGSGFPGVQPRGHGV
jgi:hypothetical protein